ncbi:MAG: phosphopantothenoylcysteine decarboxylase [Phycisphaerae bacterium]|nr:phosphopantothenoylcysteine decarboxylase [Phycisphaerae bacterium]
MPDACRNLLLTFGPTYEPIDAVRFIGNRSSGRLGASLADAADRRGWAVTALIGPNAAVPERSSVKIQRFRTTSDLQQLLSEHTPNADLLIMAAAVADFRPANSVDVSYKLPRSASGLVLKLEATPDLLAGLAGAKRSNQVFVGFALEDHESLTELAIRKKKRKMVDYIVANPLETMDSDVIDATIIGPTEELITPTGPRMKSEFADYLLAFLERDHRLRHNT